MTRTRSVVLESPALGPRKALGPVAGVVDEPPVVIAARTKIRAFGGDHREGAGVMSLGSDVLLRGCLVGGLGQHTHLLAARRIDVLVTRIKPSMSIAPVSVSVSFGS